MKLKRKFIAWLTAAAVLAGMMPGCRVNGGCIVRVVSVRIALRQKAVS